MKKLQLKNWGVREQEKCNKCGGDRKGKVFFCPACAVAGIEIFEAVDRTAGVGSGLAVLRSYCTEKIIL